MATLAGDSPQGRVHTHLRTGGGGRTPHLSGRPPGSLRARALEQVLGTRVRAHHGGTEGGDAPVPGPGPHPRPHHLRHPPKPPVEGAWRGAGCTERRDCPQNHLPFIRHRSRVQTPRLSRGGWDCGGDRGLAGLRGCRPPTGARRGLCPPWHPWAPTGASVCVQTARPVHTDLRVHARVAAAPWLPWRPGEGVRGAQAATAACDEGSWAL